MTRLREEVADHILECARKEFLEKGYSDASLRTIAAAADTTTGSIYSRFGGKEGLFSAIVEPAADTLVEMFLKTQKAFHALDAEQQPEQMETYVWNGTEEMLDYIYDHFEEFQLLLDASYGTKFQDFVDRLVEIETEYTYKYMNAIDCHCKDREFITEEFVHIMTTAMFESMFEVVRHKMKKEIAARYLKMLMKYHHKGWDAILNDKSE